MQTELTSQRTANARLKKQIKGLKSLTRVHIPSMIVGMLVGGLSVFLWRRRSKPDPLSAEVETAEDQDGTAS